MSSKVQSVDSQSAKARILQAGLLLFARMPFSETSLRDIASEAQVDVAYVHRAFGSKAEIFRQALNGLADLDGIFVPGSSPDIVIDRICDQAFLRDPKSFADVQPLHLVMQSCACSEARHIIDSFVTTRIAWPLARAFGQEDNRHAMLAVSLLCGFVTMRVVIGSADLQRVEVAQMKAMLANAMRAAMTPQTQPCA